MDTKTYTISDLEKITELNRRTIHFYTKERLLPPPEGAGGGARYGEEHVLRLKLIGEMQRSRLKLSEIRIELDAMSIEMMRTLVEKIDESPHQIYGLDDSESWLSPDESVVQNSLQVAPAPSHQVEDEIKSMSFLRIGKERHARLQSSASQCLEPPRTSQSVREESWQRFDVTAGLEVNVRSDIVRRYRPLIMQLVDELKRKIRQEG